MSKKPKIKVYYNSACPVCSAGVTWQMGRDGADEMGWSDVHSENQLVDEIGADLEFVRERLHAVDENGELQVGFDVILTVWRNSPKDSWKARILSLPVILQAGRIAYNLFAAGLYRWNRSRKHW
jgi:predicted DCC family thiol-disulfide oxidoreductase YuxK